jgi:hypothetical protein
MNALAAAALAAGQLLCEFDDGHRKSALAALAGDPPRVETVLLYDLPAAQVLDSRRAGKKAVAMTQEHGQVHLVENDGPSIRVTTLTHCLQGEPETCIRFGARHAWHFDPLATAAPPGAATGRCERWRVD